jgi:hypothetical protein
MTAQSFFRDRRVTVVPSRHAPRNDREEERYRLLRSQLYAGRSAIVLDGLICLIVRLSAAAAVSKKELLVKIFVE